MSVEEGWLGDINSNVCVCVPGLTAAAMAELQKLQKMKMMMSLQNGNESDNDDLHSNAGLTAFLQTAGV